MKVTIFISNLGILLSFLTVIHLIVRMNQKIQVLDLNEVEQAMNTIYLQIAK